MSVNRSILYLSTHFASYSHFTFNIFPTLSIRGCLTARSVLSVFSRDSSFFLSFLSLLYSPALTFVSYSYPPTPPITPPPIVPDPNAVNVGATSGATAGATAGANAKPKTEVMKKNTWLFILQ